MSLRVKFKGPGKGTVSQKLRNFLSPIFLQQVQTDVVEGQIKKLIRSGQSPVEGHGRFVQYKDRKKYPAKKKGATPVNLTLGGDLLAAYVARRESSTAMSFGISTGASREVKARAKANNEGTFDQSESKTAKGIPPRRIIPIGGESFTVSVIRKLKSLYAKRLKSLLSKNSSRT